MSDSSKNEEITSLASEIMNDILTSQTPLHNTLMKTSRLAYMLKLDQQAEKIKGWAKDAEYKIFEINAYQTEMTAAKDPDVSVSSANPNQHVMAGHGNSIERMKLRTDVRIAQSALAAYRTEAFAFALDVYTKWQLGNIAESIFEKKRKRTDPVLIKIFPDYNERIKSIEDNLQSKRPEDWKNSVVSCRTLLMDLADVLNPKTTSGKDDYINRLKDCISPKSKTKGKLLRAHLDEVKKRIEHVSDMTQGAAHKQRPTIDDAEDAVLYTYLVVAELMGNYLQKNEKIIITSSQEAH